MADSSAGVRRVCVPVTGSGAEPILDPSGRFEIHSIDVPSMCPGGATPSRESSVGAMSQISRARWGPVARAGIRPTTYDGYESLIRMHVAPALGQVPLRALRPLHIQAFYPDLLSTPREGGRTLSSSTVRNVHRVLVLAFSWALRWGLISDNPARGTDSPRPRRPEFTAVDQPWPSASSPRSGGPCWSSPPPWPSPRGCAGARSSPFGGRTWMPASPWPRSPGASR